MSRQYPTNSTASAQRGFSDPARPESGYPGRRDGDLPARAGVAAVAGGAAVTTNVPNPLMVTRRRRLSASKTQVRKT